jgi:hypothetical protein
LSSVESRCEIRWLRFLTIPKAWRLIHAGLFHFYSGLLRPTLALIHLVKHKAYLDNSKCVPQELGDGVQSLKNAALATFGLELSLPAHRVNNDIHPLINSMESHAAYAGVLMQLKQGGLLNARSSQLVDVHKNPKYTIWDI